jgi:adenylosuccinate synthase
MTIKTARRHAVLGAQWGDEGKGKVIAYLAWKGFDWVVRYAGGPNAGHTVYHRGKKYVHHLLPSIDPDSTARGFLGSGMVLDLATLLREVETLETDFPGVARRFFVDRDAFLILAWHRHEDALLESRRRRPIGTTGRGIGPAYTDKIARQGLRVGDLFRDDVVERLDDLLHFKQELYREEFPGSAEETIGPEIERIRRLEEYGVQFTSFMERRADFRDASLLFEGAQGFLLDIECGTYPFVTSSNCGLGAAASSGFVDRPVDRVYGISKAYATRVGGGPFPTEIEGEAGEALRQRGGEFGATTGRPRRVGWLDLPALRYAIARGGITHLILTKQDVLDGMAAVQVCVAYRIGGEVHRDINASGDFDVAKPVYRDMAGWRDRRDPAFLEYLSFVEKEIGVPIELVSYGPGTDEMCARTELVADASTQMRRRVTGEVPSP